MNEQMNALDASKSKPLEGGPSFSLGHRSYRALWNVTWLLLARWTPPFMHPWRRVLLRLFGAKIAGGAHVYPSVRIWDPRNLEMDSHSCLGRRADCYSMARISLGAHAIVSQDARLCAGLHDIDDPEFQLVTKPIVIGDHAWVASGAFVGPGVSIGEGAVLGACAVAFKDLREWGVYIGNPMVFLRTRHHLDRSTIL
ncbi:MAG: putative colanic acid biosynthesis acetyltransferase [Roseiarcus sp.]